jgi:predicted TIM-barrel fold metal-dependent hydrolase
MASKYRIVDVDAHYQDDPRPLHKYMEEPWRTRIRDWSGKYYRPVGGGVIHDAMLGGRVRVGKHKELLQRTQGMESSRDSILETMEMLDFETIVMVPSQLLQLANINDKDRAIVMAEAHAKYMLDDLVDAKKGIYCCLPVTTQDPVAAAKLIDTYGHEEGICAVLFVTVGPVPPLGDRFYDPIYDACERVGLPCILHSGFNGPDANTYAQGFGKWSEAHGLDFAFSNMIHLTSLVMQGIKERYPTVDFILQESGIFYIPQMMYRLDNEYMRRRSETPWLKKLPSEYCKDFYYGTQPLEMPSNMNHLKMVFDIIDAPNTLMYASDYPHYDWDHPSCIERLTFLSEQDKYNILGENARKVLRFKYHKAGIPMEEGVKK